MNNQTMGDKELMDDSIASQKLIESTYNTYANECVNPSLRSDFLNILKEEHDIQADLFNEVQKRGWYQTKPADQNDIVQSRQKFSTSS
jgi:spore coat protein CotF